MDNIESYANQVVFSSYSRIEKHNLILFYLSIKKVTYNFVYPQKLFLLGANPPCLGNQTINNRLNLQKKAVKRFANLNQVTRAAASRAAKCIYMCANIIHDHSARDSAPSTGV